MWRPRHELHSIDLDVNIVPLACLLNFAHAHLRTTLAGTPTSAHSRRSFCFSRCRRSTSRRTRDSVSQSTLCRIAKTSARSGIESSFLFSSPGSNSQGLVAGHGSLYAGSELGRTKGKCQVSKKAERRRNPTPLREFKPLNDLVELGTSLFPL